jgi:hypothetical protein
MHKTVVHMYCGGGRGGGMQQFRSSDINILPCYVRGFVCKMLVLGVNERVFAFPLKF